MTIKKTEYFACTEPFAGWDPFSVGMHEDMDSAIESLMEACDGFDFGQHHAVPSFCAAQCNVSDGSEPAGTILFPFVLIEGSSEPLGAEGDNRNAMEACFYFKPVLDAQAVIAELDIGDRVNDAGWVDPKREIVLVDAPGEPWLAGRDELIEAMSKFGTLTEYYAISGCFIWEPCSDGYPLLRSGILRKIYLDDDSFYWDAQNMFSTLVPDDEGDWVL